MITQIVFVELEAATFAEEVFPRLHEEGEALPVKFSASDGGWSQAA